MAQTDVPWYTCVPSHIEVPVVARSYSTLKVCVFQVRVLIEDKPVSDNVNLIKGD